MFSFLQGEICCPGKHQLQDQIGLRRAPSVARRHLHQVPAKRHHSQQTGEAQLGEPFCLKPRRGLAFIFGDMTSGAANLEQGAFAYWLLLGKCCQGLQSLQKRAPKCVCVSSFLLCGGCLSWRRQRRISAPFPPGIQKATHCFFLFPLEFQCLFLAAKALGVGAVGTQVNGVLGVLSTSPHSSPRWVLLWGWERCQGDAAAEGRVEASVSLFWGIRL